MREAGEAAWWGLGATPWCGDPRAGRRRVLQQETRQTLGTRVPAAASQSLLSPGPHRTDHLLPSTVAHAQPARLPAHTRCHHPPTPRSVPPGDELPH